MKNLLSKKLSIVTGALLCCNAPLAFVPLTSCSSSNAIQLANFESYMASELIEDLQKNFNIQFPYYTVAEMIPAKFEKYYDIAVPCGYELMSLLEKGWLEEIDWAKFGVSDMEGNAITNAEDAKKLFIGSEEGYTGIETMNQQFTTYINNQPEGSSLKQYLVGGKFNILRFGVPYFAQSFMFAYTGSQLTFYKNGTQDVTLDPDWSDIFYTISPLNKNQDERFRKKKIALVDDARSFHDVSRIVESIETKEKEVTNEPIKDASKNRVFETMNHITDKFVSRSGNSFILNSDSQIVSKSVADRKGDGVAVLSWSGDTIYAAQGAEEYEAFTAENFHIQKPSKGSLDEIEFMVMNKKNQKNQSKRDNIYKVVKQCCLNGCEVSPEKIVEYSEEKNRYEYWTMTNWDNILYTPMLKNIHKAVCNKEQKSEYWISKQEEQKYSDATVDMFIDIINGSIPSTSAHLYGTTLSNLQNSNNHWAWLESRGKL